MGSRYHDQLSDVTNAYVVVDYDNAKGTRAREATDAQARVSLQRLVDSTERLFSLVNLSPRRTYFELYGGWRNPDGHPSEENQRLTRVLVDFIGVKIAQSRTSFSLVQSIQGCSDTFIGTRDSGAQKMVDGMMVLDLATRAVALKGTDSALVAITADVDIHPGLVAAATLSEGRLPLFLLRLLLVGDVRPDSTPQDRLLGDRAAVFSLRR